MGYVLKLGRNIISLGWLEFLWFMNIQQHAKLKKLGKLFCGNERKQIFKCGALGQANVKE